MQVDFLIVGQGISGTMLAWNLQNAGSTCLVIDDNNPAAASKVAAGLINPVTGRRLVKSWMIEELMESAIASYDQLGKELGITAAKHHQLIQFFNAPDLEQAFNRKLEEEPQYLSPPDETNWREYFNYPFGWGIIEPCYVVDTTNLLKAFADRLRKAGSLITERLRIEELEISNGVVNYNQIRAGRIIFCDGAASFNNAWFSRLPFALNKGQALIVEIPGLPRDRIYKFRQTLIPVSQNEHLFWFGSNYEWTFTDDKPSGAYREQSQKELSHFLRVPYKVIDHLAAIRPANVERRPFVGVHPIRPELAILNGMGTKGCSLAPFFARQLAGHLTSGSPLLPEADIRRFSGILRHHHEK